MRGLIAASISAACALIAAPAIANDCANPERAIGLERIIEVDTSGGPIFGGLTKQKREPSFLRPKEVVLTFDDGPSPWVTPRILDTLELHCTSATFFSVGKMAVAYPDIARDIITRGHTLGGHTWAHPRQLPKMPAKRAQDEIERGFAALDAATGGGIAPFFRFTGLNDSAALLGYLQKRGVATFTVDVVSDDSFIADPDELIRLTLKRVENRGGGILLFHDIKPGTAKALPAILEGLKNRGFKVVHLRHRTPLIARSGLVAEYRDSVASKLANSRTVPRLMPFYGAISMLRGTNAEPAPDSAAALPVTLIAPAPRDRSIPNRMSKKKTSNTRPKPEVAKPAAVEEELLPWKKTTARSDGAESPPSYSPPPAASTTSWHYSGPENSKPAAPYLR